MLIYCIKLNYSNLIGKIENSKIELNMIEEASGIAYIDEWLVFQYLKKDSGILKCSYQGWYGNRKKFKV